MATLGFQVMKAALFDAHDQELNYVGYSRQPVSLKDSTNTTEIRFGVCVDTTYRNTACAIKLIDEKMTLHVPFNDDMMVFHNINPTVFAGHLSVA